MACDYRSLFGPHLLLGFAGIFYVRALPTAAVLARVGKDCRGAEKPIHLDRRCGGGTTARAR